MLRMSVEALRALPVFNFVRMAYAYIILTKLYVSARCSTSQIGKVLDRETIQLKTYLPAMIDRLSEAVGPMECRSPATFLGLLLRLRVWYENQEMHEEFTEPVKLFGPDNFTPPDENDFKAIRNFDRSSESLVSELAEIHVGHQPAAQPQVNFDQLHPFADSFNIGEDIMNNLPVTAHRSLSQSQSMDHGNSLLFDPSLIAFDMEPNFWPDGIGFSDLGFIDWTATMGHARGEEDISAPKISEWNSNS